MRQYNKKNIISGEYWFTNPQKRGTKLRCRINKSEKMVYFFLNIQEEIATPFSELPDDAMFWEVL